MEFKTVQDLIVRKVVVMIYYSIVLLLLFAKGTNSDGSVLYSGGDGEITPEECGMYLIPSTLPGAGRGVVAGTNFHAHESIEIVPTITINMRTMEACQLKNYGFGSGFDDHALIIFGPGNIYNHRDPYTMGRF